MKIAKLNPLQQFQRIINNIILSSSLPSPSSYSLSLSLSLPTQVKQDVGCVTVLINNAGIVSGEKFLETSDDKAALTFQVNTVAHLWVRLATVVPFLVHYWSFGSGLMNVSMYN